MASTIAAGTSAGTAIAISGDTSGALVLQTNGTTTAVTLDTSQNATFAGKVTSAGALTLASNGTTTAVTIDTSQNVGIGTSTFAFANRLVVKQSADNSVAGIGTRIERNANDSSLFLGYRTNSDSWQINASYSSTGAFKPITFHTSDTEAMRIDSNGLLMLSTTSALGRFTVSNPSNSTVGVFIQSTVAGDVGNDELRIGKYDNNSTSSQIFARFTINNAANGCGSITGNGANSAAFGSFSDERLKENISCLPTQLDNVLALRPVEFDYKDGSGHQIGFIAQEMQAIYPDTVGDDGTEEKILTITGWDKTTARLVKAIQEQQALIIQLQADVAALKGVK